MSPRAPYQHFVYYFIGKGKASTITETSSLAVETVDKKEGASAKKRFSGDASQVVVKGPGLKKAFFNRMANFTIDVKGAGELSRALTYYWSSMKSSYWTRTSFINFISCIEKLPHAQ